MEDERDGLGARHAELVADELLRVVEDLRVELDVARRVDAVHVTEGGGHGEAAVGHLRDNQDKHPLGALSLFVRGQAHLYSSFSAR